MAVTINPPTQLDHTTFLVTFSSDLGGTPTFYLWQDGILIAEQTATEYTFHADAGEGLQIHIFDSATDAPDDVFPARVTIGWDSVPNAVYYDVQEKVSSVWTTRQFVQATGKGFYNWRSRYLEDVTTHEFRVVAVDAAGERGAAINFSGLVVRHPDPPDHTLVFSGGNITIDAA